MPRIKLNREPLLLAAMPGTQVQIADRTNLTPKTVSKLLIDMCKVGMCHVAHRVASNDGRASVNWYQVGKRPTPADRPFNRDLLKRPPKNKPEVIERGIDPTLDLHREPLNALFGM